MRYRARFHVGLKLREVISDQTNKELIITNG